MRITLKHIAVGEMRRINRTTDAGIIFYGSMLTFFLNVKVFCCGSVVAFSQIEKCQIIFGIRGLVVWSRIDQKSIKARSPRWGASRHRFFIDLGISWEASWEA